MVYLAGPELLIILIVLAALAAVVAVVAVAVWSSRRTEVLPPTGYLPATRTDEIERLAKLRADGALSDEEFQREKRRVLGS